MIVIQWSRGKRLGPTGGGRQWEQSDSRSPVELLLVASPAWPSLATIQPPGPGPWSPLVSPGPPLVLGHIIYITTFTGDRRAEQGRDTKHQHCHNQYAQPNIIITLFIFIFWGKYKFDYNTVVSTCMNYVWSCLIHQLLSFGKNKFRF